MLYRSTETLGVGGQTLKFQEIGTVRVHLVCKDGFGKNLDVVSLYKVLPIPI